MTKPNDFIEIQDAVVDLDREARCGFSEVIYGESKTAEQILRIALAQLEALVQDAAGLGLDDLPFFACGPMPMLKALCKTGSSDGQCSLEARMGCGFGACMGCSIKTRNGMQRVCKEGPVFSKEVLLWET